MASNPSTQRDQSVRGLGWIIRTTCSVMVLAPRTARRDTTLVHAAWIRAIQSTPR
jgi:hypothetical protein